MRRLDELALRLMDGPLSPTEHAELDALIADPANEQRFLQLMSVHHGLVALTPDATETGAVMRAVWRTESSAARIKVRRKIAPRRRRRSQPPVLVFALAAAALLVVGLGAILASRSSPVPPPAPVEVVDPTPPVPPPTPVVQPEQPAAPILAVASVRGERDELSAGGSVTASVPARVDRVGDDTTVALEPGAELEILAADRWRLTRGLGEWVIAPQPADRPFRIATPHAEITVLGTGFELAIDPTGSEIRMRTGLVRFANLAGTASTDLGAGEAARIDADGVLTRIDQPPPDPAPQPVERPAPAGPAVAIARWDFSADDGEVLRDISGGGLDLRIGDPARVQRGPDGMRLLAPVRILSDEPASALSRAIRDSGAFTVVLDVTPARLPPDYDVADIGTARIVTISADPYQRNLTVGQGELRTGWDVCSLRVRAPQMATSHNGLPAYITRGVFDEERRVRLVISYAAGGVMRLWQDGELVHDERDRGGFDGWDLGYHLALGAEVGTDADGMRPWLGTYHALAIYDQVLSPQELP